ncbi:MAG: hypothetical protein M1816_007123 [Peltula sp. TS41687]|nr:MAG: hypothetical protein M1816_007123 [Peltula sp. TS41687]
MIPMGSRKRAKPNPRAEQDNGIDSKTEADRSGKDVDEGSAAIDQGSSENLTQSTHPKLEDIKRAGLEIDQDHVRKTRSWYGGAWPRVTKAVPVTQVARESISAATAKKKPSDPAMRSALRSSPPSGQVDEPPRSPSLMLTGKRQSSTRASPLSATTTKLNIISNGAKSERHTAEQRTQKAQPEGVKDVEGADKDGDRNVHVQETVLKEQETEDEVDKKPSVSSSRWLDWLSRPGPSSNEKTAEEQSEAPSVNPAESKDVPPPENTTAESNQKQPETQKADHDSPPLKVENGKSWLGYWKWGVEPPKTQNEDSTPSEVQEQHQLDPSKKDAGAERNARTGPPTAPADPSESNPSPVPPKGSTWAFWSKARADSSKDNVGEIAVADAPSQTHPQAADVKDVLGSLKSESAGSGEQASRGPVKPMKRTDDKQLQPSTKDSSVKSAPEPSTASSNTKPIEVTTKQVSQKALPPNLLLPSFRNTYYQSDNQSFLQQLARLLVPGKQAPPKHVALLKDPPRIKKALAIGIHGYFPAPLVRTLLGQPTGTSLKFADAAADAIKRWASKRGYECEIEKVALEGEGKIGERVDMLWKLLLNWIDHIQKSDFVLIACHSQGVPVAIMLVAKLIEFGCINASRIGVCAMAGVNLGPFPDYKSRLFSGSAGELFDFSNPNSAVSKRYQEAMRIALQHGVRTLFVGSIDDQLVPLESSTFSTLTHPYIYRAVFVDGRVHASDFITHLVGFALKLRNLGVSDHGLIRELSSPLAGSLYTGEGHSRLYDDPIIYDLAVEHALETTSLGNIPLQVQDYEPPSTTNPFILPWAMRGLLEEEYVRKALHEETAELLAQFENWKPSSKVLKDVKFRLEAVKSKL